MRGRQSRLAGKIFLDLNYGNLYNKDNFNRGVVVLVHV